MAVALDGVCFAVCCVNRCSQFCVGTHKAEIQLNVDAHTLDVVFVQKNPWEWGWDAGVAIGTILLAIATFAAIRDARRVERMHRQDAIDREERSNCRAANQTNFEILRAYNEFLGIRRDIVDPMRQRIGRHLEIMPVLSAFRAPVMNYESLAFLLESDDRNVLVDLMALELEIQTTLTVIQRRNLLHESVVQPTLEKLGAERGQTLDGLVFEDALGFQVTAQMRQFTDYMIAGVDTIVRDAEKVSSALRDATKKIYPNRHVVFISRAPDPQAPDSPTPEADAT